MRSEVGPARSALLRAQQGCVLVDGRDRAGVAAVPRTRAAYAGTPVRVAEDRRHACATASCRARMDQNGHARITRRDQAFRIPENGVAQRRAEPGFAQLSRSIKPASVRFPLISARAVPFGALGHVPAGQQEISQCQTKCSSMPRIRRRPELLLCVASTSKSSTSNPRTESNFAVISI